METLGLLDDSGKLNHGLYIFQKEKTYVLSNDFELVIPKGYTTDLASIPKPVHSFMSPLHTGLRDAGIIHDYLYDNWRELQYDLPEARDRKWCDIEFRKQCKLNWRKWVMYYILRISSKAKKMYKD